MRDYAIFYALAALAGFLWFLAFRYGSDRTAFRALLGCTLGGLALWMWEVSEPSVAFSDFNVAYYPAGRAILQDLPHLFRRCWDTPVCGFVNIPIVAFLFTPFAMLTLPHAQWLFASLSVVSLILSLVLLWSITDRAWSRRWAILLLFAVNGPLFYSLKEGNLTHFALLLLVAGVVCLEKRWDRSAGACFAMAAIIKLPLLLFGVYFVGRRQWAVVIGYAAAGLAVSLASVWYAGWDNHVNWYREVILPFSNRGLTAFNVQSTQGVLLRLHLDSPLYSWKPVEVAWGVKVIERVCGAFLMGVSCLLFVRQPGRQLQNTIYLELSMVLCLALIVSPISWSHYYLLLLLPLALYAGDRLPIPDRGWWPLAMLLCLLCVTPPVTFAIGEATGDDWIAKLVLSHYVTGALLLWTLLAYARWRVAEVRHCRLVPAGPVARAAVPTIKRIDA